jgi:hypothetical protein
MTIFIRLFYNKYYKNSLLSILICKGDTNFWDDFFVIPILPLKNNFHIKIDFQLFLVNNFFFLTTKHNFHIKVGFQFFL